MKRIFTLFLLNLVFVGFLAAQKNLTILLVHDNDNQAFITDSVRHAITGAGYSYTDYDAVANGAPAVEALSPYELVLWTTGTDATTTFWNGDLPNDGIKAYLDAGGMLWLEGLGLLDDLSTAAPVTYTAGDFTYDYLGISAWAAEAHTDDDGNVGLPQMDVVADNGICTVDPVAWRWSTMWSADAVDLTSAAQSVYNMGPSDYALAGNSCMLYNEIGDAKILTSLVRWDGFESYDLAVSVTTEVLDYFNTFSTVTKVDVTSIDITSATDFTISENNGTLQLAVTVLPINATNNTVTWSIASGSVDATIDQEGLLTASGFDDENGTVHVVATANDGSGIVGNQDVTISNQALGEGYKVLLVNDNANGATRYYEIDTALAATGYIYKIFNASGKGENPTETYLNNFDFVIWYTGNDAVDLYFWDVSDSSNIQCNAALKTYADNGGVVWLQGLDFLYDIYGAKYTEKNAEGDSIIAEFDAGDFVYDYLGVTNYVAQAHANDGVYSDGVPQLDIDTDNNDITTLDPVEWVYTTMWYVDALAVSDNAKPLYYMGPNTYDFSLYYAMVANTNGDANFITSPFETARLDNQENTNQLIKEVIDYYKNMTTGIKHVNNNTQIEFKTYPNPVTEQLFVEYKFEQSQTVKLQITDISGKVVLDKEIKANAGFQTETVEIGHLKHGVYNVSLYSSSLLGNKNIIVVK